MSDHKSKPDDIPEYMGIPEDTGLGDSSTDLPRADSQTPAEKVDAGLENATETDPEAPTPETPAESGALQGSVTANESGDTPADEPAEDLPAAVGTTGALNSDNDEAPAKEDVAAGQSDETSEAGLSDPDPLAPDPLDEATHNDASPSENNLETPTPPEPTEPTEPTQPAEDLETTVVRRQSLMGAIKKDDPDVALPEGEGTSGELQPVWAPRTPQPLGTDDAGLPEETLLAGASVLPAPISRAASHWWAILAGLLLTPIAWLSLNHAGGLLAGIEDSQWATGAYSAEGLGFLILGIASIIVLGITARSSSVGMFLAGSLLTVSGALFVFLPSLVQSSLASTLKWMADSKVIVLGELAYYLELDGSWGRILTLGIAMLMVGVVSHSARRQGRKEQIAKDALARVQGVNSPSI
ncbi:MAG: hypothetical protein Q4G30_08950 [Actinomycetaceae bacterium]|nr:hypothetical protein [Actinomycetaceae bacterium]